ncbi:hypothetical protein [Bacillus paramycoides]|uniref:hypothetical protein n=1 Tax=Bacillus paramycoides TaxID=2026194 RepID=UPI002E1D5D71|nr:hypothetical protein [Bacillus paramycoides]
MKKNEVLFRNVEEVLSFVPVNDRYDYKLEPVNYRVATKLTHLIRTLNRLEREGKLIVCLRGFSLPDEHEKFKEEDLNKFFVVGQKGREYLARTEQERSDLYTYGMNDREKLVKEIQDLYKKANGLLKKKKTPKVDGQISAKFIDTNTDKTIEELQYNKVFLTAFLHNVGNLWSGKKTSPLISATYGMKKKETAKKFATNNLNGFPKNNGFIILSYIPLDERCFEILTEDVNKELARLGVTWYKDVHKEVMLLDGIMPQRIIGIFEVFQGSSKENFILNPWLYKMFLENGHFNYRQGIRIDQENFDEFAKDLKYGAYIMENESGRYNKKFDEAYYHTVPSIERD